MKNLDWRFMLGYAIGIAGLVSLELVAVFNDSAGDTISEGVWTGLAIAPVVWWSALGLSSGFGLWMFLHFFWRKR